MTVSATIDQDAAARVQWDVTIVGAGVAGAFAARQLALAGCRTLLVDKGRFPRYKICGSCLDATALQLLKSAGLGHRLQALGGHPLNRLRLHCAGMHVDLPIPEGHCVSRDAFDSSLIEAALEAGANFLPETTAEILTPSERSGQQIRLRGRDRVCVLESHVTVLSSGLAVQVLPESSDWSVQTAVPVRIGVGCRLRSDAAGGPIGAIGMAVGNGGYVGMVRLEDGSTNLAAALDREFLAESKTPATAVSRVLEEAGVPIPDGLQQAAWKGTVALTRQTTPVANRGVFLIGDAAGYVEPFTGEGMAWAMQSGNAAIPWVCRAVTRWSADTDLGWQRDYRRIVLTRQRTCRWLGYLLRNSHLRTLSMQLLTCWPWLARLATSH